MRTRLPFDTEKERKPIKFSMFGISWRQFSYLAVTGVLFMQLVQWTWIDSVPFYLNLIVILIDILAFIPASLLAFMKHPGSGLFMDKYLWFYYRHKSKESGLWRRF